MVRKKFKYELTPNEVNILSIVIDKAFTVEQRIKDKNIQLALCVLLKVRNRLAVNIFGSGSLKVSFNQSEALAFHILYMKGYIVSNFLTQQIFTPIDRATW